MFEMALIAHDQPPTVIHPPEAPLHVPAVMVVGARMNRAPTLGMAPWPADKRGDRGLDTPPTHIPAEGLIIVGSIGDQCLGPRAWTSSSTRHSYGSQSGFSQCALVRLRACDMQPEQQALAISRNHAFRTLANLRPPDTGPPFFRWDETAVQKGVRPLQYAVRIQVAQQPPPDAVLCAVCCPGLEAPPAGRR